MIKVPSWSHTHSSSGGKMDSVHLWSRRHSSEWMLVDAQLSTIDGRPLLLDFQSGMCLSTGSGAGGERVWQTHPREPNHPPTKNQKGFPLGKNEILIREPRMRGPFQVRNLFFALIPTHASPPCVTFRRVAVSTGPRTVTRSSLRMLRWVAAFCRPLRPVPLLALFPRLQSPVVGVPGLCWMWRMPFVCQRCPIVGVPRLCWLLRGSFDGFCCPRTSAALRSSTTCFAVFPPTQAPPHVP